MQTRHSVNLSQDQSASFAKVSARTERSPSGPRSGGTDATARLQTASKTLDVEITCEEYRTSAYPCQSCKGRNVQYAYSAGWPSSYPFQEKFPGCRPSAEDPLTTAFVGLPAQSITARLNAASLASKCPSEQRFGMYTKASSSSVSPKLASYQIRLFRTNPARQADTIRFSGGSPTQMHSLRLYTSERRRRRSAKPAGSPCRAELSFHRGVLP